MSILIHVSVVIQWDDGILLVQEGKQENLGRWNLPGGHLENGETLTAGALREVWEETGLNAVLQDLVGIYTTIRPPHYHAIRFVFRAQVEAGEPSPGDDILAVRAFSLPQIDVIPDESLVGRARLRSIVADANSGVSFPLECLHEPV